MTRMADVKLHEEIRLSSGSQELDRVLGGGIIMGSAILIGGDPGIGKSPFYCKLFLILANS